jgi:hypothetical protein
MKANELRINNYLLNDGVVIKIDARSIFDIWNDEGLKNYQPIILTEEWLLKFGFTWNGLISKGQYLTIFTPCGKALVYNDNFFIFTGVTIETPIQYVHQLQNLYFALTGKELKIES